MPGRRGRDTAGTGAMPGGRDARDGGRTMAPKLMKDAEGHVVERNGLPVWKLDDGSEETFDGPALHATFGTIREERDRAAREARELQERVRRFGNHSDEDIVKALERVANLDQKKLIEADKLDEVIDHRIRPMREAWEQERATLQGAVKAKEAALKRHVLGRLFAEWDGLKDWFLTPDLLEAKYGAHFEVTDTLDVIPYVDAERTEKLYMKSNPGVVAPFAEAISTLLDRHPQKDKLRRGVNAQGSDAPGQPRAAGGGQDFSNLSPEDRLTRFRQQQAGAR